MSEKQKSPPDHPPAKTGHPPQDPGARRGIEPEETHRQGGNKVPDQGNRKSKGDHH
jgi:hypothetical protein